MRINAKVDFPVSDISPDLRFDLFRLFFGGVRAFCLARHSSTVKMSCLPMLRVGFLTT